MDQLSSAPQVRRVEHAVANEMGYIKCASGLFPDNGDGRVVPIGYVKTPNKSHDLHLP